ncbi:hypothetical protein [Actinocorallia longicatena]|uniref:Uncharacterized protein n=1 Tax=Actinocorallia longicatena TaxID=111803 RepID=A0ABP6Q7C6_9ACTN
MESSLGRAARGFGRVVLLVVLLGSLVVGAVGWWWNVELPRGADRVRKADVENNLRLVEEAPGRLRRAAADGAVTAGEAATSLDPHWTATRTAGRLLITAYYRVDPRDPGLDRCVRYALSVPLGAGSSVERMDLRADSPECEELSRHTSPADHDAPVA